MHWWTIIHQNQGVLLLFTTVWCPGWINCPPNGSVCSAQGWQSTRSVERNAATVFLGFSELSLMQLDLLINPCIWFVLFFFRFYLCMCTSEFYKSCGTNSWTFVCAGCLCSATNMRPVCNSRVSLNGCLSVLVLTCPGCNKPLPLRQNRWISTTLWPWVSFGVFHWMKQKGPTLKTLMT